MKRRTNLFYTGKDIDESNFLTFSNYTEHLTGVALATEFKLYPSQFICFYIPKLEIENEKSKFIKDYLIGYYENKLAYLRDNCFKEDEDTIYPDRVLRYLAYLIEAIMKFDSGAKLVYKSKITEQDYNGTFTDIICTIDSSNMIKTGYKLVKITENLVQPVKITNNLDKQYLYGWYEELIDGSSKWMGPSLFESVIPKFDTDINGEYYYRTDTLYKLNETETFSISNAVGEASSLKFNVIIPLYDIVHFNPTTNTIILPKNDDEFEEHPLDYVPTITDEHAINVPYGIWFANETIELKRADFKNYAPSWSLLIGTQFKPFPNSEYLSADTDSSTSKMAGFATFAQVLSKHNEILDSLFEQNKILINLEQEIERKKIELEEYINKFSYFEQKITELEKRLDNIDPSGNSNSNHKHIWELR